MDLQRVLKSIDDNHIDYMRMEMSDIYGIARCKTIPARHFQHKATNGINFGKAAFIYFDPVGELISEGAEDGGDTDLGDAVCYPDYDTYAALPWCPNTARVLINPTVHGKPMVANPREIAKTQCLRLKERGYSLLTAHEHEFLLTHVDTKKPAFNSYQWNATARSSFNPAFTQQIDQDLKVAGVDVESIETENAPGQMEVTYKPAFGLRAADNAHTFRTAIKEIAQKYKYTASFMTKYPVDGLHPNSTHLNHSLWA